MTKRTLSIGLAAAAILAVGWLRTEEDEDQQRRRHRRMTNDGAADRPPPEGAPAIAFFTAEPTTIEKSQPSQLRWSVTNATNIQIDHGIGEVSPNGRRAVYPTATTTYTLTASGPGGATQVASATVTVATPPPPPGPAPTSTKTVSELVAQLQDLHFDYDKSDVRPEDQAVLTADVAALKTIFANLPERHHHRGRPLRRARLGRIQHWPRRQASLGDQRCAGCARRIRRQAEDGQLRQGAAYLHRRHGIVLSAEPPRPLQRGSVVVYGAAGVT